MNRSSREKRAEVKEKRSRSAFRIPLLILGLAGIGISGYLTYIHYRDINGICLFGAKCDEVLTSVYAQMWDVPISLLGLLMYTVLTLMGFWLLRKESEWGHLVALGTYAVALSGTIFTGYLYYLEIFVIHAFCSWCIISSVVIVSILVLSLINLFTNVQPVEKKTRRRRFKLSNYIQW